MALLEGPVDGRNENEEGRKERPVPGKAPAKRDGRGGRGTARIAPKGWKTTAEKKRSIREKRTATEWAGSTSRREET